MAGTNRILFSSYLDGGPIDGRSQNLPGGITSLEALASAQTVSTNGGTATIRTYVYLLPIGLNQKKVLFKTPSTVAEIQSAST